MMTRSQTRYSAIWKYALILPLVGVLSYVFAQQQIDSNPLETIHVIGFDQPNSVNAFDAEKTLASFKADLKALKSNTSEKSQHNAYNLFSARYVRLMTNHIDHKKEIQSLAENVISEFNAPFEITMSSEGYDFPMVIPNWVIEKSTVTLYGNSSNLNSSEEVFNTVEEMPLSPGCEDITNAKERKICSQRKMLEFIYSNIKYPKLARESNIQGTVIVDFMITKEGKVADLKLMREIGGGCGDEALRIISEMPTWIPGKQKGKNVNVRFVLPVKYKLDGGEGTDAKPNNFKKEINTIVDKYKPLIIVDEKEVTREIMSAINPDDIEVINVLKGKKAKEKYGDKGLNGVIEITTKKNSSIIEKTKASKVGDETFMVVEEMPRFTGCEDVTDKNERKMCAQKKMLEFIYSNIKYPEEARDKGVEGTTVVRFIVDKSGEVRDAELVRDIGGGCGDAALAVVDMMPKWIPGKQRGETVSVYYNLPIKFKLSGDKEENGVDNTQTNNNTPIHLEKSLQLTQFQAFPNPAEDQLTITFTGEKQSTLIRLIDASGKELFRDEQTQFSGSYSKQINLKGMARGSVFLQVVQGDAKYVEQIVLK